MKTLFLLCVGALAGSILLTARVSASPGGFSGRLSPFQTYAADGVTALHTDPILQGGPRRWSFGLYADLQRRRVESTHGVGSFGWDADTLMFTVGYDVLPQVTLIAGGGRSDLTIGDIGYGADSAWLAAARVRILDYFVFDPMKGGDLYWCRLDSVVQYGESDVDRNLTTLAWSELRAALTVSFVTRPRRSASMDSIGIYAGPAYSRLKSREEAGQWRGNNLEGKDEVGFVAGVFANPGRNTLLKFELNRFERNSLNISGGFHF